MRWLTQWDGGNSLSSATRSKTPATCVAEAGHDPLDMEIHGLHMEPDLETMSFSYVNSHCRAVSVYRFKHDWCSIPKKSMMSICLMARMVMFVDYIPVVSIVISCSRLLCGRRGDHRPTALLHLCGVLVLESLERLGNPERTLSSTSMVYTIWSIIQSSHSP